MRYAANSAWQLLSVLAFNLMRGFQLATTAERRGATRTRRSWFRFEIIHTLRYLYLHRAGVMVRPDGYEDARRRPHPGRRRALQAPRSTPGGVIFCLIEVREDFARCGPTRQAENQPARGASALLRPGLTGLCRRSGTWPMRVA
jgi:hypothetical protein